MRTLNLIPFIALLACGKKPGSYEIVNASEDAQVDQLKEQAIDSLRKSLNTGCPPPGLDTRVIYNEIINPTPPHPSPIPY